AGGGEKRGEKVARTLLGRPGSRYHLAVDANGAPLASGSRPATKTSVDICCRCSTSSPSAGSSPASSGPTAATPRTNSKTPSSPAASSHGSASHAAKTSRSPPALPHAKSGAEKNDAYAPPTHKPVTAGLSNAPTPG